MIVAGLNQDFRAEPFGEMHRLMNRADVVTYLTAVCVCCGSEYATRTQRLIDGEPAPFDSPVIQVGGKESYQARCRMCHEVPGGPNTSDILMNELVTKQTP